MTKEDIIKIANEKEYRTNFDFILFDEDALYCELYLIKRWLCDIHHIHLNIMYVSNKNIGVGYIWGIIESPDSDEKVGLYYTELDALIEGLFESLSLI